MRQKKAILNSIINILTFIITFLPNLFLQNIFLDILGDEMRGLNSLYSSIIGWLSIVELGAGTAIIFSLYKPYAYKDYAKIRAYLKFYKNFYLGVGCIILLVGIIIIPFLDLFIANQHIDMNIARVGFILYLLNSFISYLFSSRLCILTVAQENYKISIGTSVSKILIMILQIISLYFYPSFILFLLIQFIVNLLYFILINKYIVKYYQWINYGDEVLELNERKKLLRNVKAMFMHRIGSLMVFGTDNLLISKFLGLSTLGYYANYQMIISAVQNLIGTAQQGVTASIGNLLVESNHSKALDIHKKIFFLNFWITSFITISLYNTLNQFIVLWVGENYLLDNLTVTILLINFYFSLMRGSVERFKEASGAYFQDRFAPFIEGLINLFSSLIFVKYLGLSGVFLGTVVSNFTVIFWVQPYIVYKYVFKERLSRYILMYFKYTAIGIGTLILTSYLVSPFKYQYTFISFIINCLINIIVVNSIYILVFFKTDNFNYYRKIIGKLILKRAHNNSDTNIVTDL